MQKQEVEKGEHLRTKCVQVKLFDGITVTDTVFDASVKIFLIGYFSKEKIPVLPNSTLSCLIMKHFHEKLHRDVVTTVIIRRRKFWILKLRRCLF